MIKFVTVSKMLPDTSTGEVRFRVGHKMHNTREEAQREADQALFQNLPYRSRVTEINDPWSDDEKEAG